MIRYLILLGILMGGCASHMTSWRDERGQTDLALEEMRIEISDLKHALHAAKVDQQLLEEKVKSQDTALKSGSKAAGKSPESALQLVSLERKLSELQKNYEKLSQDLKQTLTKYQEKLRELDQEIASQNRRLEEVVKLKGTLSSLSQVLKEKSGSSSYKKYRIKSGDSLEKIAKQHRTSVETLKKLNDMSGDRIIVGQEISVPDTDE